MGIYDFIWDVSDKTENFDTTQKMNMYFAIIAFSITIFYIYFFTTKFEKSITIKNKFMYGDQKFSKNMISDFKNNIYIVKNSPLLLKFRGPELLSSIKEDHEYIITGYGRRIPFMGLYENILSIKSKK